MATPLDQTALDQLFLTARTHNSWQDTPVPDDLLIKAWDTARWGPTSMNCCPVRLFFIRSAEAKEKLKACLSEGNIDKAMSAPVTVIIARDSKFYVNMPRLFPHFAGAADMFESIPELSAETAQRNATLQGAYFILACRALGIDCGPMSGFDADKVNEAFFKETAYEVDFLCNIGFGDPAGLHDRGPRPAFDEVCEIL